MNKELIRKNHNVAIQYRKATKDYNIVRYASGFNKEPITLLKGVKKDELEKKIARVLQIIADASTTFTVFIKPQDRKLITQIAIAIEDAGINSSDVHIQSDGKIIFWSDGDTAEDVRNTTEDVLMDIGLTDVGEMVSVAKKVPLPGKKTEMTEELVEDVKDAPEPIIQTPNKNVIQLPQEKIPTPDINKEQELYFQLKAKASLHSETEKLLFKKLQAKYEPEVSKPTIEEDALSILKASEDNTGIKIETDADLFTQLQKRGHSINDILTYFATTK